MKFLALILGLALSAAAPSPGQTLAPNTAAISASYISDSFGMPLATALLCFQPVAADYSPAGFRLGSVQIVPNAVCGNVKGGALQTGMYIAQTPAGVYYHIFLKTPYSNIILRDYGITQITGNTWTLDGSLTYVNGAPLAGFVCSGDCSTTETTATGPITINGAPNEPASASTGESVDEYRLSTVGRSAGWLATEYAQMTTAPTLGTIN